MPASSTTIGIAATSVDITALPNGSYTWDHIIRASFLPEASDNGAVTALLFERPTNVATFRRRPAVPPRIFDAKAGKGGGVGRALRGVARLIQFPATHIPRMALSAQVAPG
ncbi:hypothetical protein GCM10008174_08210 [Methylopila turkensis]|uniref:Uncharacterized protein n=1 Tax=Methylopila turkensis TaxID=1437816 RepID=A0A9W6JK09_9HYPH|nr:hypothetical protein GCM10008174_08210 [Methylopila turkensis]